MVLSILIKHKRAQAWGLDLLVAFVIFILGVMILYFYAINYRSTTLDDFSELYYEADLASSILLSENGILFDGEELKGKIDQVNLENFDLLSDDEKKDFLGVSNNFYFTFDGLTLFGLPESYVGIMNVTPVSNQVKVTRIVIYNNTLTKFEIYSWK